MRPLLLQLAPMASIFIMGNATNAVNTVFHAALPRSAIYAQDARRLSMAFAKMHATTPTFIAIDRIINAPYYFITIF